MTQEQMRDDVSPQMTSETSQVKEMSEVISKISASMAKVRVVHGANEQYFDNLEGKTVGIVRKRLREVFNIPGDADALISGKSVGDDFVLQGGQSLEFVKPSGTKGYRIFHNVQK